MIEKTSWVTEDKQDGFSKYVRLHARIVQSVFNNQRRKRNSSIYLRYVYIDTHSGSGDSGQYGPGSPVLFLRIMQEIGLECDDVRARSGGQCEDCHRENATEVHHLRYGPDLDPSKVVHVCHTCHCQREGKAS